MKLRIILGLDFNYHVQFKLGIFSSWKTLNHYNSLKEALECFEHAVKKESFIPGYHLQSNKKPYILRKTTINSQGKTYGHYPHTE